MNRIIDNDIYLSGFLTMELTEQNKTIRSCILVKLKNTSHLSLPIYLSMFLFLLSHNSDGKLVYLLIGHRSYGERAHVWINVDG